jgi:hypothetical protein
MVTSFTVEAVSKLVDEAFPQLRKMQRAISGASATAARAALPAAAAAAAGDTPRRFLGAIEG